MNMLADLSELKSLRLGIGIGVLGHPGGCAFVLLLFTPCGTGKFGIYGSRGREFTGTVPSGSKGPKNEGFYKDAIRDL